MSGADQGHMPKGLINLLGYSVLDKAHEAKKAFPLSITNDNCGASNVHIRRFARRGKQVSRSGSLITGTSLLYQR
jgi:hypothetical protein